MINNGIYPILCTQRIKLREHMESDKKYYYKLMSDPITVRYYGRPVLNEISEVDKEFNDIKKGFENSAFIKWAVELNSTHQYIGCIGVWGLNNSHRKATISCIFLPEYWGKGLAKEALARVINYLFSELQLNRLQLYVDPVNQRALQLFKSTGFQIEGILREYEYEYGHYVDIAIMSLLKKDI